MNRLLGAALLAMPALLSPIVAGAAPAAPAAAPAPAGTIIPLPLQPIVPAIQRACSARTASGLGYTMLRAATGARRK